jgi:hypothetical protein
VAEVQGQIHEGEITVLYVEVSRKRAAHLIRDAAVVDASCFCVVNDVRMSRFAVYRAPLGSKKAPHQAWTLFGRNSHGPARKTP